MGAAARGDLAQLEVGSEELPGLGDEAVEVAFGAGRVDERGGARDVEAGDELGGAPRGPRRRRGGARAAAPGRPAPSASARRAGDRRVAHEASNLHHGNGLGPPCTPIAPSPGHDRATTVLLASGGHLRARPGRPPRVAANRADVSRGYRRERGPSSSMRTVSPSASLQPGSYGTIPTPRGSSTTPRRSCASSARPSGNDAPGNDPGRRSRLPRSHQPARDRGRVGEGHRAAHPHAIVWASQQSDEEKSCLSNSPRKSRASPRGGRSPRR